MSWPMRILASLSTVLLGTALLCSGCDSEDDDSSSSSSEGSTEGGGDRASTILGLSPDPAAGSTAFSGNCGIAACHGPDGDSGPTAMPLSMRVPALTDEAIVGILLNGQGGMPAQDARSDQELADVVAYLNETFSG